MLLLPTVLPHFGGACYCVCWVFKAGMRESNSGFHGLGTEVENGQAAVGAQA